MFKIPGTCVFFNNKTKSAAPEASRKAFKRNPAGFRPDPGRIPAGFRPVSGRIPAGFRPVSGRIPAGFRPDSDRVPCRSGPFRSYRSVLIRSVPHCASVPFHRIHVYSSVPFRGLGTPDTICNGVCVCALIPNPDKKNDSIIKLISGRL